MTYVFNPMKVPFRFGRCLPGTPMPRRLAVWLTGKVRRLDYGTYDMAATATTREFIR